MRRAVRRPPSAPRRRAAGRRDRSWDPGRQGGRAGNGAGRSGVRPSGPGPHHAQRRLRYHSGQITDRHHNETLRVGSGRRPRGCDRRRARALTSPMVQSNQPQVSAGSANGGARAAAGTTGRRDVRHARSARRTPPPGCSLSMTGAEAVSVNRVSTTTRSANSGPAGSTSCHVAMGPGRRAGPTVSRLRGVRCDRRSGGTAGQRLPGSTLQGVPTGEEEEIRRCPKQ